MLFDGINQDCVNQIIISRLYSHQGMDSAQIAQHWNERLHIFQTSQGHTHSLHDSTGMSLQNLGFMQIFCSQSSKLKQILQGGMFLENGEKKIHPQGIQIIFDQMPRFQHSLTHRCGQMNLGNGRSIVTFRHRSGRCLDDGGIHGRSSGSCRSAAATRSTRGNGHGRRRHVGGCVRWNCADSSRRLLCSTLLNIPMVLSTKNARR
mmetsp:Transcript_16878/g.34869  ORF Transcript_16878/g.34869 Transcript_16878/m.34869 type:complete len:205 (-) Transcript_16878:84-698(-)